MSDPTQLIVVDAANVIGANADGWWRDRAGAARRLLSSITDLTTRLPASTAVTVVLEGAAKAAADGAEPTAPRLRVVLADRSGDDKIVDVVAEATGYDRVTVVTADRELRRRADAYGADSVGPHWLLRQFD
ncbi:MULTISPECIES: NYN domain-containing protein [unclassified Nocardia]|uniref:NYN domain-containing protein n=1 Tax=unclassified Nocardia TaxID=2637762 RepID=UPI0033B47066